MTKQHSSSYSVTTKNEEREPQSGQPMTRLQDLHTEHDQRFRAVCFIEVQIGSYLAEDDIERLEDDFGRT